MAADAYAQLAGTLERVARAAGQSARLADVLNVGDLSRRTAIPEEIVASLIEGKEAPDTALADRVRQRLDFVRESRRRPDGKRYSLDELAAIAGVTRQTMSEWRKSGMPSLESADRLRRFFGLPAGFLTADEPEALDAVLQPVLQELEAKSDPLAALRTPGFYRLAQRAPHMSRRKLRALAEWAEMITERESEDDEEL